MKCPDCGGTIDDGEWICPSCEYIVDASFLGPNITNEAERQERMRASERDDPDGPTGRLHDEETTGGLEVSSGMIMTSLEASQQRIPTDDLVDDAPLVIPQPMDVPPDEEDNADTNVLPDALLPTAGVKPLDPGLLQEIPDEPGNGAAVEPPPLVIVGGDEKKKKKKKGLPKPKNKKKSGDDAEAKKREVLARAMTRGPIQERRRSKTDGTGDLEVVPAKQPELPTSSVSRARPPPEPKPEVNIRSPKAEKIFQQALEDIEAGNLPSARTNIKLALTFDPGNERYMEKLVEITEEAPAADHLEDVQKGVQFANQYFEKAKEVENQGDFDEAIKQLEKAIRADPQGVYYNHLGMILAFQQGKLKEGKKMVEKAIQMSPRNKNYQKNLSKIMSKMGMGDDRRNVAGMLGGLLSKRK